MSTHQPVSDVSGVSRISDCPYPHCDSYVLDSDHDHSFCSDRCFYRSRALAIFEDIRHDRRYCTNCYRQIREVVERGRFMRSSKVRADVFYKQRENRQYPIRTKNPDDPYAFFREDDNRHAAVPLVLPTKNTIHGAESRAALADPHPDFDYQTANEPRPSADCVCGSFDNDTVSRPIVGVDKMIDFSKRLSNAVSVLHDDDTHRYEHDRDVLLDMVRERKTDQENHTPDQHIFINSLADAIEACDTDR